MLSSVARRFLLASEPFAATVFWAPEIAEAYERIGLDPLAGYFCGRSAGMGRASAAAVTAAFYNFNPSFVEQFLRWDLTDPEQVAVARTEGVRRALTRLLDGVDTTGMARAAELLRDAAQVPAEGRVLFAATRSLPWPDDALGAAWFGATVLREYRGDGHVAVLVKHGISAPEALLMHAGYAEWSDRSKDFLLQSRVWPADQYEAAKANLQERGFVEPDGTLTDAGAKFREMIEMETDRVASAPFERLGAERSEELIDLLAPWSAAIVERKGVPRASARLSREPSSQ